MFQVHLYVTINSPEFAKYVQKAGHTNHLSPVGSRDLPGAPTFPSSAVHHSTQMCLSTSLLFSSPLTGLRVVTTFIYRIVLHRWEVLLKYKDAYGLLLSTDVYELVGPPS